MIRNLYHKASPGFWPTAGALLALYIALAGPCGMAQGQESETTNFMTSPKEAHHE